ncbi:oxidoreductase [Paracnuella aquatica]|uniref:oxidoreductase n=1 Tax=Paracnuella aquatica TaxID=2268757 RepID=UPI000DEF080C|nr:oxidoreductase [Paracnuella aquatica]RPD51040.1 SDR family NAD(P)-dependent oxidoreductase [Paracnuella aquatica]
MSKVWLITGASSGLGAALAAAALQNGHKVAATFRKPEQAADFTTNNNGAGLGIVLDVTSQEQVTASVQQAIDHFGRIDVLVNNAGYGTIGAIEEFSMEEVRQQFEANFFGAVALTKQVLPAMRQQGSGQILFISSAAGFKATGGFGVYNSSKFALEGFAEALAQEVGALGIRVTIVQPGPFRTQFAGSSVKLAQHRMDEYKQTPVAQMYHYISRIDGKQEGDPEKGAHAIIDFVASDSKTLRLPLGKHSLDAIRAKLRAVASDLDANERIALSTMYEGK